MLCQKPFRRGVEEFGCGKCPVCQLRRKAVWTCRLMLERIAHEYSWFVTLTYREVPSCEEQLKRDYQLFLKLLRARSKEGLRYFLVKHVGSLRQRPHFHMILFGLSQPELIEKCWKHGFVKVGSADRGACAYVAGYMLEGEQYARMSLRPGIGFIGADAISREMVKKHGADFIAATGDVPTSVRIDGRVQSVGRYLRRKVREGAGFALVSEPEQVREARCRALQEELASVEGRLNREQTRIQHGYIGAARSTIALSRKSL